MTDYVVNVEIAFTEAGTLFDRIRSAAEQGFRAQDFWRWQELDLTALQQVVERAGVTIESFVVDWRTPLTDARCHAQGLHEWEGALRLAEGLGTRKLIVVPGDINPALDEAQHVEVVAAALAPMAAQAHDAGVTILLEPVNCLVDHPGTWMSTTERAFKLIDAVAQPAVKLLCDVYHQAITGESLADILPRAHDIAYVQFADAPGRGEPTSGAIDWASICRQLSQAGCAPRVGLEFIPNGPTGPSLHRAIALLDGYW